jgi:hypothetical protein
MEHAVAELSSVSSQIDELTRRITEAAVAYDKNGREDVGHELFEVERALRTASRRLNRALRDAKD